MLFETERLLVRRATPDDAAMLHALWSDGRVMRYVGFPDGLPVTPDSITARLKRQAGGEPWGKHLVVARKADGALLGEAYMSAPDAHGLSETDVKLLPQYWGQRYGLEIKRGLLDYLFTHSDCQVVQATPHVENRASIRMQEEAGGVWVGQATSEAGPDGLPQAVPHLIYHVPRLGWKNHPR